VAGNLFVFDLDGTLIDSSGDIAVAANRTLESYGRPPMEREAIKEKIGWGVNMLLAQLMPGIDEAVLLEARSRFLAFYGENLMVETRLYDGVRETLFSMRERGRELAILTNKPEGLSRRIISELGLEDLFVDIVGGDTFSERKPHPAPLLHIIREAGVGTYETIFVSDSPIDCETGRRAGVFTVGVAYGFRPVEELKDACCETIIDSFGALLEMFP